MRPAVMMMVPLYLAAIFVTSRADAQEVVDPRKEQGVRGVRDLQTRDWIPQAPKLPRDLELKAPKERRGRGTTESKVTSQSRSRFASYNAAYDRHRF